MPPNAISAECGKGTWLEGLERLLGPRLLITSGSGEIGRRTALRLVAPAGAWGFRSHLPTTPGTISSYSRVCSQDGNHMPEQFRRWRAMIHAI